MFEGRRGGRSIDGSVLVTKTLTAVLLVAALAVPPVLSADPAGAATTSTTTPPGYWLAGADGSVYNFGSAPALPSMAGQRLVSPVVAMASSASGNGYWLAAADGGIFAFGDSPSLGSMGGQPLNKPVVGVTRTPSGKGYWMVATDGGLFSFGDATFHGSMGGEPLNKPVVGMTPVGPAGGYRMVASDGGIFSFGAPFYGSMGGEPLNAPIVGMAPTPTGKGYWMVARDGGIFSFGDAGFHGSMGGQPLVAPIVAMASSPTGMGYWMVGADGGMFSFGDAGFAGSMGGQRLPGPIVGMATPPPPKPPTTPTDPPPPVPDAIVLAAGDIASCDRTGDEATAAILDEQAGTVLALGDLVYPVGTLQTFIDCYGPSWGRHKARTKPAVGNHEYDDPGAAGYFSYFEAAAGPAGKGWYSYDLGAWHVVALNSELCVMAAGCGAGTEQFEWFKADLAANSQKCTVAYWHHPRFSSDDRGDNAAIAPLWDASITGGVDLVLAGHYHAYERYAPLSSTGTVDAVNGVRQFIVGSGGRSFHVLTTPREGSEVRNRDTFGVLKLTLKSTSYDWQFLPQAGKTFTDTGSAACR